MSSVECQLTVSSQSMHCLTVCLHIALHMSMTHAVQGGHIMTPVLMFNSKGKLKAFHEAHRFTQLACYAPLLPTRVAP